MTAGGSGDRFTDLLKALQARVDQVHVVLLVINDNEAVLAVGGAPRSAPGLVAGVRFGALPLVSALGMGHPPTPLQLERAIERIEDSVMPLAKWVQPGSVLFVEAAALEPLWRAQARAADVRASLSIDEVEFAFLDLASAAESRYASAKDGTTQPLFSASLLLLREAMHHLRFKEVRRLLD
jgi:hypothetical protein